MTSHAHMSTFDPRTASEEEIWAAASWLEGKTLREIGYTDPRLLEVTSSKHTKNLVGDVYESYFNIRRNSDPRPDFIGAGIELKSTGLKVRHDGTVGQKERLSLTMMGALDPDEDWATSTLRRKLDHLLIIFYGWKPDVPIGSFETLAVVRWSPQPDELDLLGRDWNVIHRVWRSGGVLSESLTRVLASSTKGPGRRAIRTRGFSLKPPFMHSIYQASRGELKNEPSLQEEFGGAETFENETLTLLHRFASRPVGDVGQEFGVRDSSSLNAQASIIRAVLGLGTKGRSKEFERYGLQVKTVPLSPKGIPWEAMSFPAFRPVDLASETWDESELLGQLNRLLIVPLVRPSRKFPRDQATVGRAFFWSPSDAQLRDIRKIWEAYRDNVARGRPEDYPRLRDHGPIFVNSHGRDAMDTIESPGMLLVKKRSFWLDPRLTKSIVVSSHPAWAGY